MRVAQRRSVPLTALAVAMMTAPALAAPAFAPKPSRPPNIVVILADDLGIGDIGPYGGRAVATPHLDALAKSGVRLDAGYVSAAVCSPSRAGLLTGRYQQRFGHEFNIAEGGSAVGADIGLPRGEATLADRLKAQGYVTGLIGKWHLGSSPGYRPTERGFDEFFGTLLGFTPYALKRTPDVVAGTTGLDTPPERRNLTAIYRNTQPVEVTDYLTGVLATEAAGFVDRHRDRPFFLLFAPTAPHTPLQAKTADLARVRGMPDGNRRIYHAMVATLDDAVGQLLASIERNGLARDTLVIFLSDNGCATYLGEVCSNGRYHGGKRWQLDGGIRVPFLIRWPGVVRPGSRETRPMSALDLAPTLLAAAGAGRDASSDGVDLRPYLTGHQRGAPHAALFWRAGPNRAIRAGDWKYWQVAVPGGGHADYLFNLARDPDEQRNLAERQPARLAQLQAQLAAWDRQLRPPAWASERVHVVELNGRKLELHN